MFHNLTSRIVAITLLLGVSASPMTTLAASLETGTAPVAAVQSEQIPTFKEKVVAPLQDFSLEQLRQDTKAKMNDTQDWVEDQTIDLDLKASMQTLDTKVDRFQDSVKPNGAALKSSLKNNMPGKGVLKFGERQVSVFGFILMIAFGFALLLLSLAGPNSRLGGRH